MAEWFIPAAIVLLVVYVFDKYSTDKKFRELNLKIDLLLTRSTSREKREEG